MTSVTNARMARIVANENADTASNDAYKDSICNGKVIVELMWPDTTLTAVDFHIANGSVGIVLNDELSISPFLVHSPF